MPARNKTITCSCGVREGEFHIPGCDMEPCPFCGSQLISCDCPYEHLGLRDPSKHGADTAFLPSEIYANGLTDEQSEKWDEILRNKGLVPFIQYPIVCALCGGLWPEMFIVSNEEWRRYIPLEKQREVVCPRCYVDIRKAVDAGQGIEWPLVCAVCGTPSPELSNVSRDEWVKYIQINMRDETICGQCFGRIKRVIDHAVARRTR